MVDLPLAVKIFISGVQSRIKLEEDSETAFRIKST
jgi:hypothetical protein